MPVPSPRFLGGLDPQNKAPNRWTGLENRDLGRKLAARVLKRLHISYACHENQL